MARPTKIDIMGIEFKIVYPKKISDDGVLGECDYTSRVIKIQANLKEDLFESCLRHEVIHAILGMCGISHLLKHEMEEAIVLAIEHGLDGLYERVE